ncbi:MAG: MATE family efflux transporter [Prevotellaceae bacterium]|jgi:putative MATE family efflux protein|nr:MATE family efflux transporter [Prevotellaceae bacterium]
MQKQSTAVLGNGNIRRLLTRYSIPAIIAMTASSLYNLTDSIFIGKGVHHLALSGLTVTFPFMNLAAAFGSMVGIGASTLISIKLGQKDYRLANRILGNVLVLNILIGIFLTVAFLPFLDHVLYFFGASDSTIVYARDYMKIILLGNVVTHMYFGLNAVLRSAGFPNLSMYITLISVAVNCIVTPIFIFVFGWGIQGSALATILSQVVSLAVQFICLSKRQHVIHFQKGIYRLHRKLVSNILYIGMSPFLMNACACLIVILITRGFREHGGDIAVAAYGMVNRIVFIFVMIIMGLNQGMQPIAGFNYGAGNYRRVTEVTRLTIICAISVATLGFLVCELFPDAILHLFTSHTALLDEARYGLRIVFIVFPIVGFQMVASNFFMSIGQSKMAIFLSLTRQVLFLIPCLLLLPRFLEITGIWISIPVADSVSSIVTALVLFRYMKRWLVISD